MARPRKDADNPGARERIIDAFWSLLEQHHIGQIGIKEIIAAADCNRATFYYHFKDIYDLLRQALSQELTGSANVPQIIFTIFNHTEWDDAIFDQVERPAKRIALAMKHGGAGMVQEIVSEHLVWLWEAILCCDQGGLKPRTLAIIRFEVCGMLGMLYQGDAESPLPLRDLVSHRFISQIAPTIIGSVCEEQGVSIDEVRARLTMLTNINGLSTIALARIKE